MTLINQTQPGVGRGVQHGAGNASRCDLCGELPPDAFARDQTARDCHLRYRRRRTNRYRVPDPATYYGATAVALATTISPRMIGRLVCLPCSEKLWAPVKELFSR